MSALLAQRLQKRGAGLAQLQAQGHENLQKKASPDTLPPLALGEKGE